MRAASLAAILLLVTGTSGRSATETAPQAQEAWDAARRGDAGRILEAAREAHRAMSSFAAEGETTTLIKMHGQEQSLASQFSIRFSRPDRYRITWTSSAGPMGTGTGAVWNAGDGAYTYSSPPGMYAPAASDEIAISTATGLSQGLAFDTWALFFEGKGALADFEAPSLEGTEDVEGERCWKISGSSRAYDRMAVWIATKRLVVRKVEHSLSPSAEGRAAAEAATMDDSQLDAALRAAGVEPTPERRQQMKAVMEMAKIAARAAGAIDGRVTRVVHEAQVGRQFDRQAFAFEVPAGTPLRSSPLAELFDDDPTKDVPPAEPEAAAVQPGDPVRGQNLLDRVVARYRSLRSYVSDGEIVRRLGPLDGDVTRATTFSLRFARPERYRIVWWRGQRAADDAAEGAVWDSGEGAFEYGRVHGAYARVGNAASAFAIAAGVSDGLTRGLPPLFFDGDGWLTELRDPAFEGTEVVDGEPCDVVSGSSRSSAKHTLWIGRDLLIRRHRRLNAQLPEDERDRRISEDHAFEEMQRTATPEAKPMVDMMAEMRKAVGKLILPSASGGDTTETYTNIRVDAVVEPAQLGFEVPPGIPLKASLTEGVFRTSEVPPNR